MTPQNELDVKAAGGTELLGERLEKLVDPDLLNRFQVVRSRFRGFDETKKHHIFWSHDLAGDPESDAAFENDEIIQKFDAFVFVSYWQKETFLNRYSKLPRYKSIVIRNAIEPIDITQRQKSKKINLIYTPTPHRGLEILVPVFGQLCKDFPDKLHLDVYSSFKLYGWEERDKPYHQLFEDMKLNSDITSHGTVSNEEIRKALLKADIFAYPSIWQETSCLCLIEAMSAGCFCVCSDLAAIPETSGGLIPMYGYTGKLNEDANSLYFTLKALIADLLSNDNRDKVDLQLQFNKAYSDNLHNTLRMKITWESLLTTIENSKK